MNKPELTEYNRKVFNKYHSKEENFQIGFFNGDKILIIGQNPGRAFNSEREEIAKAMDSQDTFEEFEKEYFNGIKSSIIGKYLDSVIDDWNDVSFTNVVKVPTENNKVPTQEQYVQFFPILVTQIELLQPKVILCLGKFAGNALGIKKLYDAQMYGKSIIVLYPHPSSVQRMGNEAVVKEQYRMRVFLGELLKIK